MNFMLNHILPAEKPFITKKWQMEQSQMTFTIPSRAVKYHDSSWMSQSKSKNRKSNLKKVTKVPGESN